MFDSSIWKTIGGSKNFCAYKLTTDTEPPLCKNPYNVTGLCDEFSCPLSNSKYATLREINGGIFLFVKEPERVNSPINMYEKIELSSDYNIALEEIEEHLKYWDTKVVHKCKQRLTKLTQYLRRLEIIKKSERNIYSVRNKKIVRRDKSRAMKALNKIDFETDIKNELIMRAETGIFGENIQENIKNKIKKKVEKVKNKTKKKYVTDFVESESDCEEENLPKNVKPKKKNSIKW
ncbi:ribosomal protein L28 [Hamiltosporidium magnivora]|uniref:Protein MAK16 n=1 Tax=Hamiltosporidium magnivora TaxID=148818 RepID=A0A4Q9LG87_9MICR|nr:ribosomal protein L28 [Hamiltosporidium magnivora]